MEIPLSSPDITQAEIDAVVAVLNTRHLSLGPKLREFERAFADYIGRRHAVAVNSGTSALHLCLLALDIGPGDQVITTPFSFIATTNVILMVGAQPVFVDIDPVTYNITADAVAAKITPKTKAIIPVEVFGNPAGIDQVYQLTQQRHLLCVEDSCEALGSVINGRKIGTFGEVSTFAFYPNKQMTTGEGGIILTDNEKIAQLCTSLRNQGRDAGAGWLAHARLGYNYRLSDINCVIGIEQLKRLDQMIAKRRRLAQWYNQLLADEPRLITPKEPTNSKMGWFVYVVRLADEFTQPQRDQLLTLLRDNHIACSNYFTPIHLQPFIRERLGTNEGDFPITEKISQRTLALPFFNNLTHEQVQFVCHTLKSCLDKL